MRYSTARMGRVFIIRLEDGEILHETIERFAAEQGIRAAALIAVGGADEGSRLVVGPAEGRAVPVNPLTQVLPGVHEITGNGTLFPDEDGQPVLHMHLACGREEATVTGCVRTGVKIWQIGEVILFELNETAAIRKIDPQLGFKLLNPEGK
ncbi:MAG: DNA-binding protein [Deltaproteobacteria bacterium]|nr:DNA-binding protein [Deltaproteobacteria bacterium]